MTTYQVIKWAHDQNLTNPVNPNFLLGSDDEEEEGEEEEQEKQEEQEQEQEEQEQEQEESRTRRRRRRIQIKSMSFILFAGPVLISLRWTGDKEFPLSSLHKNSRQSF